MNPSEVREQAGIRELAAAIYRDKVQRARQENPIQKLLAGFDLFQSALEMTRLDVIRKIGASDESAVQEGLRQRFERVRQVREAGLYKPVP